MDSVSKPALSKTEWVRNDRTELKKECIILEILLDGKWADLVQIRLIVCPYSRVCEDFHPPKCWTFVVFPKRGGVIVETLCFAIKIFAFRLTIHILKTTSVLVCGQSVIGSYFNSF